MAYAFFVHEYGGPEVLRKAEVSLAPPSGRQVRLRQLAVGVNFHDIYVRSGLYKTLALPGVPGIEAVGIVEETGSEVTLVKPGDRVTYISSDYGAYADERLIDERLLIPVPESVDPKVAACMMVRGLTARILLHEVFPVNESHTILVHAASGGVGRLLCQWAKHLGATVIGTVGNEEKAATARALGCAHTILYREQNFVEVVKELTRGEGVDVVYDSVGKDTFAGSLACLKPLGHLVNFGQSSGPVEPILVSQLAEKSTTLVRPILSHYIADARQRETISRSFFNAISQGILTPVIPHEYPLDEVRQAHSDMEARKTSGAVVLTV